MSVNVHFVELRSEERPDHCMHGNRKFAVVNEMQYNSSIKGNCT